MKRTPWTYVALLKSPAGVLKKASFCADDWAHVHYTVRELWPAYQIVRITKEGEW